MSSHVKKSVPDDFVCISQEYGDEYNPFPSTSCKNDNNTDSRSTSANFSKSKASLTMGNRSIITQVSTLEDDDSVGFMSDSSVGSHDSANVVAIPDIKSKHTPKDWLDRRSQKELAKQKVKNKETKKLTKAMLEEAKLKPGAMVKTQDAQIADFDINDPPRKGFRRQRVFEFGTILRESSYYMNCWVVHFEKLNITATCAPKCLKFVSSVSPSFRFAKNSEGKIVLNKVIRDKNENDAILRNILKTKVHKSVNIKDYTYDYLCKSYQSRHTWLTSSKLRDYVNNPQNLLDMNKHSSSSSSVRSKKTGTWFELLFNQDKNQNILNCSPSENEPKVRKFLQNSHKNAISAIQTNNNTNHHEPKSNIARRHHVQEEDEFVVFDNNKPAKFVGTTKAAVKTGYLIDDEEDSHGLACTCCGVHFPDIVTPSDVALLCRKRRDAGFHAMIEKIAKQGDSRYVTIQVFPQPSSSEVWNTRDFVNALNRKNTMMRRINGHGTIITEPQAVLLFDICNLEEKEKFHDYAKSINMESFDDNEAMESILSLIPLKLSPMISSSNDSDTMKKPSLKLTSDVEVDMHSGDSGSYTDGAPSNKPSEVDKSNTECRSSSNDSSVSSEHSDNNSSSENASDRSSSLKYDHTYCYHESVARRDGRPNFCTCFCRDSDVQESSSCSSDHLYNANKDDPSYIFYPRTTTDESDDNSEDDESKNDDSNKDSNMYCLECDETSNVSHVEDSSVSVSSISLTVPAESDTTSSLEITSDTKDSDGTEDNCSDTDADVARASKKPRLDSCSEDTNDDDTALPSEGNNTHAINTSHEIIDLACEDDSSSDDFSNGGSKTICE